jgi:hypothetical protein
MSGAQVDELMQIWSSLNKDSNLKESPPFASARELYQKIDQINDSKTWHSFSFTYADADLEDERLPTWKSASFCYNSSFTSSHLSFLLFTQDSSSMGTIFL